MTNEEFKKLRKAARMTQAQFGERLGYSRQAIIHWEAGTHTIPDDVMDKLMERSLAATPEPPTPINWKTHPELFSREHRANHKHPYWWRYRTRVGHYIAIKFGEAERDRLEALPTLSSEIGAVEWTPERAVSFLVNLGADHVTAASIAREVGFDVPMASKETDLVQYHADWAAYQQINPGGGWRDFEIMFPQHRKHAETPPAQTSEEIKKGLQLQKELDDAFTFDQPKGN